MMRLLGSFRAAIAAAGLLMLATAAQAQTTTGTVTNSNSSAGRLWGSNGTVLDSSSMHNLDGSSAAQVAAAKQGLLLGNGSGSSITAIGSQSIISTTIIGDNNSPSVNATQTTSNTGTVSNNGTIAGTSP